MGKNHRKRSNNRKKTQAVTKTSETTQATPSICAQTTHAQQDQTKKELSFNAQHELYKVESQQYKLLSKLIAFLLALFGLNFIQESILSELSTEALFATQVITAATLVILLAISGQKLVRINKIQIGLAKEINDFYTKNRITRAIKSICGPGKYEHSAVLNLWQKRLKEKGIREDLSNPEIVSEMGSRFASWLGLTGTFFGLFFFPQLASFATASFLFASAVFIAYTLVYFQASNQHLVNQILRHEAQQC